MLTLLQATQPVPSQMATDIISVITALGTFVGVVLAAWALFRSGTANTKADLNSQRITNTNARVDMTNATMTNVALRTPVDPDKGQTR